MVQVLLYIVLRLATNEVWDKDEAEAKKTLRLPNRDA